MRKWMSMFFATLVVVAVLVPVGGVGAASFSHNWAGYVATGGTYTSVSGTWVVPKVEPVATTTAEVTWVGIGGNTSRDLIQAGTMSRTTKGGEVQYYAWYETLPEALQVMPIIVKPGDVVSVHIKEVKRNKWQIWLTNETTDETVNKNVRYRSSRSSAEWIVERPATTRSLLPLADFGSVSFTRAVATKTGDRVIVRSSRAEPVTMTTGNHRPLAVPSEIGADGTSFSVVRTTEPSVATKHRYRIRQ